jgi:transposase
MLAVGIDWATRSHTVALMSRPGEVIATFTIKNSLAGYFLLLDRIRYYAAGQPLAAVAFAIERRDLRLVDFLLANGFTGYLVDPNRMTGYRLRYKTSGAKDDDHDAFVLADVLLKDREQLPLLRTETDVVQRLKLLLTDRAGFVNDQTALSNRLQVCLHEYYPAALELFSDPTGKTALAFLNAYPSPEQTKDLDADTLRVFLKSQHCYTRQRLVHMRTVLSQAAVPTPAVIVEVKQQTMLGLVQQLRSVQQIIARYDAEVQAAMAGNPEIARFDGLPGAGPIVSGTLYTLLGEDRTRYQCVGEVQSFVGTVPRTMQSGRFRGVTFRFACQQDYRVVLTRWAFNSLRESQWCMRYYRRKRNEGKRHYHALRCLANILLRIAFAMWYHRTEYNEDLYLAQVTRHQMNNEPDPQEA